MSFLDEPYLHAPSRREYDVAIMLAKTLCSPENQATLANARLVEEDHNEIVYECDSPTDRAALESALIYTVPGYELAMSTVRSIAAQIMLSGVDGASIPVFVLPRITTSSDEPPLIEEYA